MATAAAAAELETLDRCPLCGASESRAWVEGFDRLHRVDARRFTYRRCASCSVVFLSPRPTVAAIGRYYPDDYAPYAPAATATASESAAVDPKRSWPRGGALARSVGLPAARALNRLLRLVLRDGVERKLRRFVRPWRPGLRFLDFGCGSEKWCDHARKLGYASATGVDFSPRVVERVRAAGHDAWRNDDVLWDRIAPGSIDFIRLNHVLEHLHEPRRVLARLVERLAPDGRLHVALPNPASLSARWFKERWFSLDCPRHVVLLPPARARALVAELGLRRIRVLHETVTKDIARSIGYGCIDRGELPAGQVEALMHDELLAELAWLPARIAALLGRSDRFHLLAQRG